MDVPGLTSLLTKRADRHSVPGGVLGILREQRVTVVHTGVANVASGEPITPGTRFGVGSITKPITATVILRLAAEGYLTIDDSLAEHVPELRESEWARTATIRDLLANRFRIPLRTAWEFDLDQEHEAIPAGGHCRSEDGPRARAILILPTAAGVGRKKLAHRLRLPTPTRCVATPRGSRHRRRVEADVRNREAESAGYQGDNMAPSP